MSQLMHYLSTYSIRRPTWTGENKIAYSYDKNGVAQVWEQELESKPEQLTFFDNYIVNISSDAKSKQTFFTMSESGNEKFQIFRIKDNKVTKLSANSEAVHHLGPISSDSKKLYYTSNERDYAHFDLKVMDLETLSTELLLENHDNYNFPVSLSPNDRYYVYQKLLSENDMQLWIYDIQEEKSFRMDESEAKFENAVWKSDSTGFYVLSNKDEDFVYLAEYNLASKTLKSIRDYQWDIETIALNYSSDLLAVVVNEDGKSKLEIVDTKSFIAQPIPAIPNGEIAYYDQIDWHPKRNQLIFTLSSGTQPGDIMLLDYDKATLNRVTNNNLNIDIEEDCVEPVLKHYQSFDDLTVPYWLYIPKKIKEIPKEGLPVVIEIHGGPEGQERTYFNPLIQYILSKGIAVVAPNVRGSTGYGKSYSDLDNVEKRLDSVKDIEWLVKNLVTDGIANADKIAVSGISYGGFMSLSSAARYPELFCAAIDIVGMFNLVTFLENTSSYRRPHRESEYGSLKDNRDLLYEVSPVAKVDNIKGPLLVIHGANDPRVPVNEAEQVVAYLEKRKVPVKYIRYEDEGHGIQKYENKIDYYSKVVQFLLEAMNLN